MARRRAGNVMAIAMPVLAQPAADLGYGSREPAAPQGFTRSQSDPNIDWPTLVGPGENSNGLRMTNPNGTLCEEGNGWNQSQYFSENTMNGRRWSPPIDWNGPRKRNRTGE